MEGLKFNLENGNLSDVGKKYLKQLISGEKLAAFALTESSPAGSNIMKEMTTKAELVKGSQGKISNDKYSLNGNKMFITNVGDADLYATFARTSDDGISLFMIDSNEKGFSVGQILDKWAIHNSNFGELVYDDVIVPVDNLVGEVGHASKYAMRMLNSGRVTIAALATGHAQRCFEGYLEIATEREIGNIKLSDLDRQKDWITELAVEINAARQMTYHAAWLKGVYDSDPNNKKALNDYVIASNGAKKKATDVSQTAARYLIQSQGANSVVRENPSIQLLLDTYLFYFGEAVPEVLSNNVANMTVRNYNMNK